MPRTQKPQRQRRDPLLAQLDGDELQAKYGRVSEPGKRRKSQRRSAEGDTDEVFRDPQLLYDEIKPCQVILDPKTSRKIFELARDQQEELEMPDDEDDDEDEAADPRSLQPRMRTADGLYDESDSEEAEEMSDGGDAETMFVSLSRCRSDRPSHVKQQLDSVDVRALDTLLPPNSGERRTLADVIFSKLENSKTGNVSVIQKVQQGYSSLDFRASDSFLRVSKTGNILIRP